ncbi:hypothetical protein BJX64DRAFT_286533 [Aspergillus heterothallicus]
MIFKLKLTILSLLSLPALIAAECRLQNSINAAEVVPETRTGLCKPQGENDWTFAMRLSELVVPTFDSDYTGSNWLPYVLTITHINFNVANGYFRLVYANGAYMIGENQATCSDLMSGLRVGVGCKTGFPLHGEP